MSYETNELSAPVKGKIYPMSEIPDPVFSEGILGKCCGIAPEEDCVYAPVDGTITHVADTGHALGITTESGLNLIIHIGVDTVEMNGKGFSPFVHADEQVKKGQKLMGFSRKDIQDAGHPDMIIFVVTEEDEKLDVSFETDGRIVERLEKIGEVRPA